MRACIAIIGVIGLCITQQAHAVIKADTPLSAIIGYDYILVGKVQNFYADKPAMMVTITDDLRGKAPFRTMPVNLKVDAETTKKNQIEPLMKRLGPDLDMIFFVKRFGKKLTTFGFTNGTWYQLNGTQTGEDQAVFGLVSAEPYFRKTFKGTTEDLQKVLKEHFAGKGKLPPLDAKEPPGFGPEYMPPKSKDKGGRRKDEQVGVSKSIRSRESTPAFSSFILHPSSFPSGDCLFAVIPTIGIGAPLAILAILFPTVFGGVFVLFRQWIAFITLISLNSTLLLLHWWLAPKFRDLWLTSDSGLWLMMTMCAFLCAAWAWRRQLAALGAGDVEAPPKTENLILAIMTACCVAAAVITWAVSNPKPSWSEVGWALTVVMTLGIAAGMLHKLMRTLRGSQAFAAPPFATEGIILGAMLLGHLAFATTICVGGAVNTEGKVEEGKHTATILEVPKVVKKWDFAMKEAGLYVSSPLIDGDFIYSAAAHPTFRGATLVCLDRHTGEKKWEFIDDGEFRQVISSPCIADGRIYIGEGFHDDQNCKLFCVDAASGKKLWEFKTRGQTESSPTVEGGKVFFGAGNEGVYCLDAKEGKELWHFPPADYKGRLLRFGAGMLVVGDRLYFGSGVDRNQKEDKGETAVFCLDAATGKPLWKAPMPYAVWSTPVVKEGAVYVTCGNGDIFTDAEEPEKPGGALICLDEKTGKEKWRYKTDNGILEKPAVDHQRVYFSCRDHQVYCIGRDGSYRWKLFLEAPLIGSPVFDSDPAYAESVHPFALTRYVTAPLPADNPVLEQTRSVFVAAGGGKVCCLNPQTGDIVWTYNLTEQRAFISASPRLVVTRSDDGYRRSLYFGCGLGGGLREITAHRPVLYCLEDKIKSQ